MCLRETPLSFFRKSHNQKWNNLVRVKMGLKHPHTTWTPTRKYFPQHSNVIRNSDFSAEHLQSLSEFWERMAPFNARFVHSLSCSWCCPLTNYPKKDRASLRDKLPKKKNTGTPLGVAALKNNQSWLSHHSNSWINYPKRAKLLALFQLVQAVEAQEKAEMGTQNLVCGGSNLTF